MKPMHAGAYALACAATLALLGACTVGPKYERPVVVTPPAYKEAGEWKIAQPRDEVNRGKWWEIFGDAQLNALIEQIDISNQNVIAAEARFRQARSLVQQARAGLFPTVTGAASAHAQRFRLGFELKHHQPPRRHGQRFQPLD